MHDELALDQARPTLDQQAALTRLEAQLAQHQAVVVEPGIEGALPQGKAGRALQHLQVLALDADVEARRLQGARDDAIHRRRPVQGQIRPQEEVCHRNAGQIQLQPAIQTLAGKTHHRAVVGAQAQTLAALGRGLLPQGDTRLAIDGIGAAPLQAPRTVGPQILQEGQVLTIPDTSQPSELHGLQTVETACGIELQALRPVEQQLLQPQLATEQRELQIAGVQALAVHQHPRGLLQPDGGPSAEIERAQVGLVAEALARQRQPAFGLEMQAVLALRARQAELMLGKTAMQVQLEAVDRLGIDDELTDPQIERQRLPEAVGLPERQRCLQGQRQIPDTQVGQLAGRVVGLEVHARCLAIEPCPQCVEGAGQLAVEGQRARQAAIERSQAARLERDVQPVVRAPQRPAGLQPGGVAMRQFQRDLVQGHGLPAGIQLGPCPQRGAQRLSAGTGIDQIETDPGLLAGRQHLTIDRPVGPQHALTPDGVERQRGRQPLRQVELAQLPLEAHGVRTLHAHLTTGRDGALAQRGPGLGQLQPVLVQRAGRPHLGIGRQCLQLGGQQRAHALDALRQVDHELLAIEADLPAEGGGRQAGHQRGQIQLAELQLGLEQGQRHARQAHLPARPGFDLARDAGLAAGRHLLAAFGCAGRDRQADLQALQRDLRLVPLFCRRQHQPDAGLQAAQRQALLDQRARLTIAQFQPSLPGIAAVLTRIEVQIDVQAGLRQLAGGGKAGKVGIGKTQLQALDGDPPQRAQHAVELGLAFGELTIDPQRQARQIAIGRQVQHVRPLLQGAIRRDVGLQAVRRRRVHLRRGRFHPPPRGGQGQGMDLVLAQRIGGAGLDILEHQQRLGPGLAIPGRQQLEMPEAQTLEFERNRQAEAARHRHVLARRGRCRRRQLHDQASGTQLVDAAGAAQQRPQRPAGLQVVALHHHAGPSPLETADADATPEVALDALQRQRLVEAHQQLLCPAQGVVQPRFGAQPHQGGHHQQHQHDDQPHQPEKESRQQRAAPLRRLATRRPASASRWPDILGVARRHRPAGCRR